MVLCRRIAALAIFITGIAHAFAAIAADSAVIFMYHHVAHDTPASTTVSPARFAEHLQWLESNGFDVLPLISVLNRLSAGEPLPDNTVVITFDDGYRSVLSEAAPLLQQRNWPFTIFVSTDYVDSGYDGYLSWDELRRLVDMGASIGNHTKSHAHLVRRLAAETDAQWTARVTGEITGADRRITEELDDASIPVLAWPYGEYDAATQQIAANLGFFGVGQHSGAVGAASDRLALPRFPIATGFDSLDDFALRARTRPLLMTLAGTERHVSDGGRPALEAFLHDERVQRDELACYAGGQGRMQLEWLDVTAGRFIARPRQALRPGRTKYNCTAPSATTTGVYHWFGYVWMTRRPNGDWYEE